MGVFDRLFAQREAKIVEKVSQELIRHTDASIEKASIKSAPNGLIGTGIKRFTFDSAVINGGMQNRKKPGSNISFETLRRFSKQHEVSRAAINYRKRQLTGLDWRIVTDDTDAIIVPKAQADELKTFFRNIGGPGNNYRKFMNRVIEDLLVLDAVALYKQKNRGGGLFNIVPVDAATIRLRVDENGFTPLPPEIAYVQWIRGVKTAEMTTDEMIYEMMNPSNDTPYGLAPLESLIIVVSSSLKAGMYNLSYLTDGNIPEGIFNVPANWTPQMIKEFQENWDAAMAGDEAATSRLKFVPGEGGGYVPTKKPEDMRFQEFNDWLMKVTCAIFDVSPNDIGFSPKSGLGGKGMAENQSEVGDKKGLLPLARLFEEIFTKVIQEEFGYATLKFQFDGLVEKDAKLDAETNEILIRSGQRTVDELRSDEGLSALGIDKPFVIGTPTFIDAESMQQKADQATAAAEASAAALAQANSQDKETPTEDKTEPNEADDTKKSQDADHITLVTEIRKFRRMALNRIKKGKAFRPFDSGVLPEEVVAELNIKLSDCKDEELAKGVFNEFMADYQVNFLADVVKLKQDLTKIIS